MKNIFFGALIIGSILVGCKEENPNQSSGGAAEGIPNQPSGVVKVTTSYLNNGAKIETPISSNNKIHGIKRAYYSNGIMQLEIPYKDGLIDGVAKEYRSNGALESETSYKDGLLNGAKKEYYNNGALRSERVYKNDKIVSLKTYWSNSSLNTKTSCSENEYVNGVFKKYNSDGSLYAEGVFVNGIGTYIEYGENGKDIERTFLDDNKLSCYGLLY
ncbi:toxin-antitoxin system YwqK family antitoxin [Campylobacter armoricus]|uniref:toxin-antitoxin system YwqK family antitoxin n=1 Tax=Campylobacter armoricus TaxID=2505970 RepID=UPI001116782F|nr:toxin-antitoxin system YwqK family antitoxin [Campylobacter armoricus]